MPKAAKVTVTSKLTDNSGNPLKGRPIFFFYQKAGSNPNEWGLAGSAATNSQGLATRTLQLLPGGWNLRTTYSGTAGYDKASAQLNGVVV